DLNLTSIKLENELGSTAVTKSGAPPGPSLRGKKTFCETLVASECTPVIVTLMALIPKAKSPTLRNSAKSTDESVNVPPPVLVMVSGLPVAGSKSSYPNVCVPLLLNRKLFIDGPVIEELMQADPPFGNACTEYVN